jgi:hypothetical protein
LSRAPYDTCRRLEPAAQVARSLAHFVKPLGQSAANAGVPTAPSKLAAAPASKVLRRVLARFACDMCEFVLLFMLSPVCCLGCSF